MLAGDFTAFASPACNGGRSRVARAVREQPRQSGSVQPGGVERRREAADITDPCGGITLGAPADDDEWQAVARIDYQLTSNHSLFGRYLDTDFERRRPPGRRRATC